MKYLMLICDDNPDEPSPDDIVASPDFVVWEADMARRGIVHKGQRLRPARYARTVRVRDGKVIVTDGPFAETREQIGGFELVECADLDEAIECAAGHPAAPWWSVEIRPYLDV
ncbi:YciI family protein [Dactylosporangium sucinum]|uniref:Transcription initiation protein n=1 Tax=Dactylosporangium sucinum TaxID=1424081 RepID=A0A917X3D8_9ACTN|nr:YciI family protein [Dactylosporangium sucinum]GGM65329.1 transcription initiation protein [Dactylosporangium sucinum]